MNKKLNLYIAIIFIFSLTAIGSFSYGFFINSADIKEGSNVIINTEELGTLTFEAGVPINITASIDNFYEGAGSLTGETTSSASLEGPNNFTANYAIEYNITTNNFVYTTAENLPEVILTITDSTGAVIEDIDGLNYITSGEVSGFDITTKTGSFIINSNKEITVLNEKITENWTAKITFVNLTTEQVLNEDKTLISDFILKAITP